MQSSADEARQAGSVTTRVAGGVARVEFFHPKKNSLPAALLAGLARHVTEAGRDDSVRVIVLSSGGDGPFCAGASFDELAAVDSPESGKEFFMGFARLILAMKSAPKFLLARVHGKAVGGGVGLAAAADYALASDRAAVKLSELALGIGPFVVGPCVERKLGRGNFMALALDTGWRDAGWACRRGLYAALFEDRESLDEAVHSLAARLAELSPEAMASLKRVFWEGTGDWDRLLEQRAAESGRLVRSEHARRAIAALRAR